MIIIGKIDRMSIPCFESMAATSLRAASSASWIIPISDTTKLNRLQENLGAANVELSSDDLRAIENALSGIEVQGARYPAHLQQRVDR